MKHGRFSWLVSLVAIFALVCGLGLAGCSSGSGSGWQDDKEGVEQDVELEESGDAIEEEVEEATEEAGENESAQESAQEPAESAEVAVIEEAGEYTSKEEVALYLHTYGHLPSNYVTKDKAEDAGWKTWGLDLWEACPGKSIGGDRFGNREGRLPNAGGRQWYECDIDYGGERSRNSKRIVYSNDGLIYYTEDHYNTFERLY